MEMLQSENLCAVKMAFVLSPVAWTKVVAHASKYPSQSVFGVILSGGGEGSAGGVDAVPVTHSLAALSSFLDAALGLASVFAREKKLRISALYVANTAFDDAGVHPLVAALASSLSVDSVLVIDNLRLLEGHEGLGLVSYKNVNGSWKKAPQQATLKGDVWNTIQQIRKMLEENKQAMLYDFDNHLDNPALDWLSNKELEAALGH
ncbi:hypothetical protein BC830DRAFT_1119006 [Chytriomyces sp. MP71]|nr:hypothetical protein BC830DRAFT_1119006 [Chytriomyces sp. MP71]